MLSQIRAVKADLFRIDRRRISERIFADYADEFFTQGGEFGGVVLLCEMELAADFTDIQTFFKEVDAGDDFIIAFGKSTRFGKELGELIQILFRDKFNVMGVAVGGIVEKLFLQIEVIFDRGSGGIEPLFAEVVEDGIVVNARVVPLRFTESVIDHRLARPLHFKIVHIVTDNVVGFEELDIVEHLAGEVLRDNNIAETGKRIGAPQNRIAEVRPRGDRFQRRLMAGFTGVFSGNAENDKRRMRLDFDRRLFIFGIGVEGELLARNLFENTFGDAVAESQHTVGKGDIVDALANRSKEQCTALVSVDRVKFTAVFAQTHTGLSAVIQAEGKSFFVGVGFEIGNLFGNNKFDQLFIGVAQPRTGGLFAAAVGLKRETFGILFAVNIVEVVESVAPFIDLIGFLFITEAAGIFIEAVPLQISAVIFAVTGIFIPDIFHLFGSETELFYRTRPAVAETVGTDGTHHKEFGGMVDVKFRSNDDLLAGDDLSVNSRPQITAAEGFKENGDRLRDTEADAADKEMVTLAGDKNGVAVGMGGFHAEFGGGFRAAENDRFNGSVRIPACVIKKSNNQRPTPRSQKKKETDMKNEFEVYEGRTEKNRVKKYLVTSAGASYVRTAEYARKFFKCSESHITVENGWIYKGELYLENPEKKTGCKMVTVAYWV